MTPTLRAPVFSAIALSLLFFAAHAGVQKARDVRKSIAAALGLDNVNAVRIRSISSGFGGQAVAEVTVDAAFRLVQEKDGTWKTVEVRAGDRRWESMELMETAIRKEKLLRTTADLRTIATALEAYRRERGAYVAAETGAGLMDRLAPQYLNAVIRLDAWSNEFQYNGTAASYRLTSAGPDGKPNSGDEIVVENGQVVRGASE